MTRAIVAMNLTASASPSLMVYTSPGPKNSLSPRNTWDKSGALTITPNRAGKVRARLVFYGVVEVKRWKRSVWTESSSALPATRATACSSRAPSHQAAAALATTSRRSRTSPPRFAPRRQLAGVSGFQVHFSSNEIYTPGDTPDVLVAMNPAALKRTSGTSRAAAAHRQHRRVHRGEPREGRLQDRTRSRTARSSKYKVHGVDIGTLTMNSLEAAGLSTKEKGRAQELLRARSRVLDLQPALETHAAVDRGEFPSTPEILDANLKASRPVRRSADHRGLPRQPTRCARRDGARPLPEHHGQRGARARARWRRGARGHASFLRWLPHHARLGDAARDREVPEHRRDTFQAEDEIAATAAAIGAAYAGSSRVAQRCRASR